MIFSRKIALILAGLLFFLACFSPSPVLAAPADEADNPPTNLYAKAAVLMDASSGRILYEKNGHEIMPMASTTKIMTCILALEYGNPEDYVQASSYASSMPKVKLHVKKDEYYKLGDLLYSLMLESHNDSAVVIAEHIGGSTEGFAKMMNQKARDIGCFDTFFITPNGLDATVTDSSGVTRSHSTTASDLAKIMSYCIMSSPKKEEFLKITRTASYSFSNYQEKDGAYVSGGRSFSCNNHNAFLTMMEGALSGKTGFTGNAGYCYVGSLRQDQRTYVVALLACGWPNNKSYKWSDTKQLMHYGLDNFEYHTLSEVSYDPALLEPVLVLNGQPHKIGEDAYTIVEIKKAQEDSPNARMDSLSDPAVTQGLLLKKDEEIQVISETAKNLTAPVHVGEQVGTVKYMVDDEIYQMEYIVSAQEVPAIDFAWCIHQIMMRYSL